MGVGGEGETMVDDQGVRPVRAEVEYVTRNYSDLQGLKLLPLALVFAVWGASEAQLLTGAVWWTLFAAALLGAVIATPLIGRWYARTFGSVQHRQRVAQSTKVGLMVIGVIAVAVVVVAVGATGRLPEVEVVALPGIVLGVALSAVAWSQGRVGRRMHPWVHRYGAVVAFVSAVPLGMLTGEGAHPLNASGVMSMVIAGFFIISGLDTHRALRRLLPGTAGAT